jgi:Gamma tubulin complex component C-terminal
VASIFTHIHNHLLFYISFSVENALCSLFRMTRKSSSLLFPTLASSDKLLMHFRFIAHSFVANLSEYVFDTAIGGNFDPFLSRLSPDAPSILYDGRVSGFSDVFSLAKAHSTLLDDILSACLLRSGQRGVGDLLRHSLELVLEFAVLAGELKNGRLQEYQAAPLLDDLFQSFRGKMTTLVSLNQHHLRWICQTDYPQTKVLKGLVDKSPASSRMPLDSLSSAGDRHIRRPSGGTESLYHLLIRLDNGDWWSRTRKS